MFQHPIPKFNTQPLNFDNNISIFLFGNLLLAKIRHFHI